MKKLMIILVVLVVVALGYHTFMIRSTVPTSPLKGKEKTGLKVTTANVNTGLPPLQYTIPKMNIQRCEVRIVPGISHSSDKPITVLYREKQITEGGVNLLILWCTASDEWKERSKKAHSMKDVLPTIHLRAPSSSEEGN